MCNDDQTLIEEQISGKHKQLIYKHKSTNKFNGCYLQINKRYVISTKRQNSIARFNSDIKIRIIGSPGRYTGGPGIIYQDRVFNIAASV